MKVLIYLLVFVIIVAGCTFAFFTMATPDIPQTVVTKQLDPKDAFAPPTAPVPTTPATVAPSTAAP